MKKCFEEYFNETDGEPFYYGEKKIQLSLHISLDKPSKFRLSNFQIRSYWKQGIVVRALDGSLKYDGIENSTFVFWQNNFGNNIDFEFINGVKLIVFNVWDTGNGVMQSGHNGAGIFIEQTNEKIVLNCNDAYPDGSMTDLIFTLTKL